MTVADKMWEMSKQTALSEIDGWYYPKLLEEITQAAKTGKCTIYIKIPKNVNQLHLVRKLLKDGFNVCEEIGFLHIDWVQP